MGEKNFCNALVRNSENGFTNIDLTSVRELTRRRAFLLLAAIEFLIDKLKQVKTNRDFFDSMNT